MPAMRALLLVALLAVGCGSDPAPPDAAPVCERVPDRDAACVQNWPEADLQAYACAIPEMSCFQSNDLICCGPRAGQ